MKPPEGVVLVRKDGTRIPLDLDPEPYEEDGVWHWVVATAVTPRRGDSFAVEVLPGQTSIEFPLFSKGDEVQ